VAFSARSVHSTTIGCFKKYTLNCCVTDRQNKSIGKGGFYRIGGRIDEHRVAQRQRDESQRRRLTTASAHEKRKRICWRRTTNETYDELGGEHDGHTFSLEIGERLVEQRCDLPRRVPGVAAADDDDGVRRMDE
jgi:hypothetical protein